MFWQGFQKRAAEKHEFRDAAMGAGAVGAGTLAASKATPLITGRTPLYHGTTREYAEKILDEGLQPNKVRGITDILPDDLRAKKLVYLTKNKGYARTYAWQAAAIKEKMRADPRFDVSGWASGPTRSADSLIHGLFGGRVLKASVPLWKKEYADKVVANPELRGATSAGEFADKMKKERLIDFRPPGIGHLEDMMTYHTIKEPAYKGMGPEVFKASPHYRRLGLGEVRQYVKAHPGRFAGGLALGAAGLGLAGYGINKLRHVDRKGLIEEVKSAEDISSYAKRKYRERPIAGLDFNVPGEIWTAKIDGAHTVAQLKVGEVPRLFSHRMSKRTGGPIEYTQKLPHIKTAASVTAQIRGETYAVDSKGRAVGPEVVTSILNSSPEKSLELQRRLGLRTMTAIIDVDHINGKDVRGMPIDEKHELMKSLAAAHPDFTLPDSAGTPAEKKRLLGAIMSGKHHQTKEGLVLHLGPHYTKAKIAAEHDVHIRDIFHEEATTPGRSHMAGGFSYSWTPDGPVVGRVGTGMDHAMKKDMALNPHKYVGKVARVRALAVSKKNVLQKPSFQHMHVEKNLE